MRPFTIKMDSAAIDGQARSKSEGSSAMERRASQPANTKTAIATRYAANRRLKIGANAASESIAINEHRASARQMTARARRRPDRVRFETHNSAAPSANQPIVIQRPDALSGIAMVRKTTAQARWSSDNKDGLGRNEPPDGMRSRAR